MDEFKGRLGTPAVLVTRDSESDSAVWPALPAPVVMAAPISEQGTRPLTLTPGQRRQLPAELRGAASSDACRMLQGPTVQVEVNALSSDQMLVSTTCWRAAYDEGRGYWVARRTAPFTPHPVTSDATSCQAGVIGAWQKGPGSGGYIATEAWTWDGKAFVHTASSTTGMCLGIATGGARAHSTPVTDVKKPR